MSALSTISTPARLRSAFRREIYASHPDPRCGAARSGKHVRGPG
ncbi:hypothetical protein ACIQTW_04430 [Paenarthrobacter sp. NPDC090517]